MTVRYQVIEATGKVNVIIDVGKGYERLGAGSRKVKEENGFP